MLLLRNLRRTQHNLVHQFLSRRQCSTTNGAGGKAESLLDKLRKFGPPVLVVSAVASAAMAGLAYYQVLRTTLPHVKDDVETFLMWTEVLPSVIDNSTLDAGLLPSADKYVTRSSLEEIIRRAETSSPNGRYTIVYGPKGVGKSSLVHHVAGTRKGVVRVSVNSSHDKVSLARHVVRRLLGPRAASQAFVDIPKLVSTVRAATAEPVTIIFDVERGPTEEKDECLMAVRSLVKDLATCSKCLIVLSDANEVVEFGMDPRENFVFVGELTLSEARELLRKLKCKLSNEEMTEVFNKIGTSPVVLENLMEHLGTGATYQTFIAQQLVEADHDLTEFPLKPILKALKDSPDGVASKHFMNMSYKGVDLSQVREVAKLMKKYRSPIVFDMNENRYKLMSTAHRTALARKTWSSWLGW